MRPRLGRLYAFAARAHSAQRHEWIVLRQVPLFRHWHHIVPLSDHSRRHRTNFHHAAASKTFEPQGDGAPSSSQLADSSAQAIIAPNSVPLSSRPLPITCPGCGALSQEHSSEDAGYYSRSRKAVKAYLRIPAKRDGSLQTDTSAGSSLIAHSKPTEMIEQKLGVQTADTRKDIPVCDRCHDLIYNNKGRSIAHPSVDDLADSIAESPFRRNHVYHVLDAADFPMSLIPRVFQALELAKPRSQNRRARHKITSKPSMSFIITRSDLLAPAKDMTDRMMPYMQSVLRKALGRAGRDIRLGNVHLVSSKRGWWTKDIKDNIWERGGGNWLVGKVNVGKSNLFEVLFPKGSGDRAPVYNELKEEQAKTDTERPDLLSSDFLKEDSLLPPPQPETPFPAMPIVSNLPGTTASPIRLPFGNHKGELIDLPGLARGDLEENVQQDHKLDLVMQYRPTVTQHIIKPGQSLLLGGGLIRITPQLDPEDRSMTMLAYPFVPIEAHVTSTDKAIGAQRQERISGIRSILAEGAGDRMASAGIRGLTTDVTKTRAGSLLRAGVSTSKLPFRVLSTDILVEGVGWVELVCQVRKRKESAVSAPVTESSATISEDTSQVADEMPPQADEATRLEPGLAFEPFSKQPVVDNPASVASGTTNTDLTHDGFPIPMVEIFSPHGKHVSQRSPLGAWLLWDNGRKKRARDAASHRPRKPMAGSKQKQRTGRQSKGQVVA